MNKSTIKFLLFTFLLTYCCWGGILLANQFGYLKYGTSLSMVVFLIGGLSPTIVSYFYLKKCGRISGLKDFFKQTFSVKQPIKGYILVLIMLATYFAIPLLMGIITINAPIFMLPAIFLSSIIGGGLEELGWRYILQHDLEKKYSFSISTLITSIIWAVWHLPLFYIVGTSQQSMIEFLPFSLLVVGFSFMLATIYRKTKSVWLCIFCHTLINSLNACFLFLDKVTLLQSGIIALFMASVSLLVVSYGKKEKRRV